MSITKQAFQKLEVEFSIHNLMKDVINTNFVNAKRREAKLVLNELIDIPFSVIGDKQRITQVCNNLVSNAIKFA